MALYLCIDENGFASTGASPDAAWTSYQSEQNNDPLCRVKFYEATPIEVEVTQISKAKAKTKET